MASLRDNNDNTMRRAYKRSRTRIGGFVDAETEEFDEDLAHRNNLNMFMFNDNTDNKQDDHDVAVFLEQSEDDDDHAL